jgi:hypothetical protein
MFSDFIVSFEEQGIDISFEDVNWNGTLDAPDTAEIIYAFDPFRGTTASGIGIGTPYSSVINEFGKPDDVFTFGYTTYYYWSRGISFTIREGRVYEIGVFAPSRWSLREKQEIIKQIDRSLRRP